MLAYTFWPSNRKRFDRAKNSILDRDDEPWKQYERDPVSGRATTGHEWNGIKELDTPVPRGVLMFLIVTHVWAIGWWFLVPAWPLGTTYTRGLLGVDQQATVEARLVEGQRERAAWMTRLETEPYDAILADEALMQTVRHTGRQLFGDNCAACHGRDGKGGTNYPDLTDDDWLWGGDPALIEQTMRVGINTAHPDSRLGQMPAFGRDKMLDRDQVQRRGGLRLLADPSGLFDAGEYRPHQRRAGSLHDDLRGLPRRERQGQPGGRRSEPDRRPLDLRRRPRHHHRLRAWRPAGPHADLGRDG